MQRQTTESRVASYKVKNPYMRLLQIPPFHAFRHEDMRFVLDVNSVRAYRIDAAAYEFLRAVETGKAELRHSKSIRRPRIFFSTV